MHVVYFFPVFSPPSGPVADQHVCSHTMEEQAMLPGTLMHTHEEHTFTHTHTHTHEVHTIPQIDTHKVCPFTHMHTHEGAHMKP